MELSNVRIIEVRKHSDHSMATNQVLASTREVKLKCTYLIFLFEYCSAVSLILTKTIDECFSTD